MFSRNVLKAALLLSSVAVVAGCSGSSSGSSESSTFSISGSMTVGASFAPLAKTGQQPEILYSFEKSLASGDWSSLSGTQCSDGYYYQVYCLDFSDTPAAKLGNVQCSGMTGSFTVSGLPLNEGIGCIVRRSTDGDAFSTVGTLSIPAASLTGSTDTLTASGDVAVTVTVTNDGTVATVITSGGDNLDTETPTATDTVLSQGIYRLRCGTLDNASFSTTACKCQQASDTALMASDYVCSGSSTKNPQSGGSCAYGTLGDTHNGAKLACIADHASLITSDMTEQFIEMNLYTATPATDLAIDGDGHVIPAGTQVPIISIWGATDATTSLRSTGGEGASTSTKDHNDATVNLTWDRAQATNAIAYEDGIVTVNGIDVDLDANPVPTAPYTVAQWKTWVANLVTAAGGTFTCSWGDNASKATDANCLAEFMHHLENGNLNVPRVRIERLCGNTGCDAVVSHARVFIDGIKFQYTDPWTAASQNAATVSQEGVSLDVRNRFVFEPLQVTPDGGGGFSQDHGGNRNYDCGANGHSVNSSLCAGGDTYFLSCGTSERQEIRFIPGAVTGQLKVIFKGGQSVKFARLERYNMGSLISTNYGPLVLNLCRTQIDESESQFFLEGTRQ